VRNLINLRHLTIQEPLDVNTTYRRARDLRAARPEMTLTIITKGIPIDFKSMNELEGLQKIQRINAGL
jgi:hypothetical protein